jgi:hypothetical protein
MNQDGAVHEEGGVGPGPGEEWAGDWRPVALSELLDVALDRADPDGRPRILAIDGRSGNGKTTLTERLLRLVPRSAVVPVDDVSWHHSMFDWSAAMVDGVLRPLHEGRAVHCRPPGWEAKGRAGWIDVPAGLDLVIIEGVGSGRFDLEPWRDGLIWVQSDYREAERRGIARDIDLGVNGDPSESAAFWQSWMDAEVPFLEAERPWDRAAVVVCGTPKVAVAHDEVLAVVRESV